MPYTSIVVMLRRYQVNVMKPDVTLSTGRVISHRPYLSNGVPNGATEAYVKTGGNMTDAEWVEYCKLQQKG